MRGGGSTPNPPADGNKPTPNESNKEPDSVRSEDLKVRTAGAPEFHGKFKAAFVNNPYVHHVTHYSEQELSSMKALVLTEDGKTGIAIKDHGDGRIEGTALFSVGPKGSGLAMLDKAVKEHGVNYLECYGDSLKNMYERLGFKVKTRDAFNTAYADPNWDYARFGKPDYSRTSVPTWSRSWEPTGSRL